MSLLEQTWTKRAQQLVAPHVSSGTISSYVWILSQPGLAFSPSPELPSIKALGSGLKVTGN